MSHARENIGSRTGYCAAGVDKRVRIRAYTTADSAVSYINHARIA